MEKKKVQKTSLCIYKDRSLKIPLAGNICECNFQWTVLKLSNKGYILIPNTDLLPSGRDYLCTVNKSPHIRSYLVVNPSFVEERIAKCVSHKPDKISLCKYDKQLCELFFGLKADNIIFTAVGMRYYNNYVFTNNDKIRLETENSNVFDPNAIKILVNNRHEAYVSRKETIKLREVYNFEQMEVKYICKYENSVKLELILDTKVCEVYNNTRQINEYYLSPCGDKNVCKKCHNIIEFRSVISLGKSNNDNGITEAMSQISISNITGSELLPEKPSSSALLEGPLLCDGEKCAGIMFPRVVDTISSTDNITDSGHTSVDIRTDNITDSGHLDVDISTDRKASGLTVASTTFPRISTINRPQKLSVTDIADLQWCEYKTYLYKVTNSVKICSNSMKIGKQIHEKLRNELGPSINVPTVTREDTWGLRLLNAIYSLNMLIYSGIAREIQIFGKINDFLVSGIIDEIRQETGTCPNEACSSEACQESEDYPSKAKGRYLLRDTKTRVRPSMPNNIASRSGRIQTALYRRFFNTMSLLDIDWVCEKLRVAPDECLSQSFLESVDKALLVILVEGMRPDLNMVTLRMLFAAIKSYTSMIAPLSETLELAYVHQSTRKTIGIDSFTYDNELLNVHIESADAFYRGDREAVGVCIEEAWKCKSCEFLQSCEWRAQAKATHKRYPLAFID